jgi:hypothetical protein
MKNEIITKIDQLTKSTEIGNQNFLNELYEEGKRSKYNCCRLVYYNIYDAQMPSTQVDWMILASFRLRQTYGMYKIHIIHTVWRRQNVTGFQTENENKSDKIS